MLVLMLLQAALSGRRRPLVGGELAREWVLIFGAGRLRSFELLPAFLSLVAALIAIELRHVVRLQELLLLLQVLLSLRSGAPNDASGLEVLLLSCCCRCTAAWVAHWHWVELLLNGFRMIAIGNDFWLTSPMCQVLELLLGLPRLEHE